MKKSPDAQRLYDDLHRQVTSRELLPGTAIPSENELAERYGISRPTVRKMLGLLCDGGFLEKRIGKGTFVRMSRGNGGLVPDRPFKIGMDAGNVSGFYYSEIMHCIQKLPYREQLFLNLIDPETTAKGEIHDQVDALLLVRERFPDNVYQTLARRGVPVVHFNRCYEIPGAGYVSADHAGEAERAVTFLFNAGCRRIALIGRQETPERYAPYWRSLGWEAAYRKFSGTLPPELTVSVNESRAGKYMKRLLDAEPDGFFFVNIAQYNQFKLEYGRFTGKSPEELYSVIFDDVDKDFPGEFPRVNFVRMPMERMVRACVEYLWQKRSNPAMQEVRRIFPCDLVIRRDGFKNFGLDH